MRPTTRALSTAARGSLAALTRLGATTARRRVVLRFAGAWDGFDRRCAWLAAHTRVVPLARLIDAEPGTRPLVALTIDHGLAAAHRHALPALERHGLTATFFVAAGLVEGDARVRERFRRALGDDVGMRWSQARELVAAGMAIGCAGWSGVALARLRRERARRDLARAKAAIEDALGEPVVDLAYPGAAPRRDWDERSATLARHLGFARAVTLVERAAQPHDDPFGLPRFAADGADERALARIVAGARDLIGVLQERAPAPLAGWLAPATLYA